MFLILIGGASGSGKTVISQKLGSLLEEKGYSVGVMSMDNYYHERPDQVSAEEFYKKTNFDVPEALKLNELKDDLMTLAKGERVNQPIFDFKTNRVIDRISVEPSDIVIVEGLHALQLMHKVKGVDQFVKGIDHFGIYICSSSYHTILKRRTNRDSSGERGDRTAQNINKREHQTVGPAFFTHVANSSNCADLHLSNNGNSLLDELAQQAFKGVAKKLSLNLKEELPDVRNVFTN